MNRIQKRILGIFMCFCLLMGLLLNTISYAAASTDFRAGNTDIKVGKTTTITVDIVNTETWNLTVTANGGKLSGTTSSTDAAGSEVSKNVISCTFSASAAGTYVITLSGSVAGSDLIKQNVSKTITIKVSEETPPPSGGNTGGSTGGTSGGGTTGGNTGTNTGGSTGGTTGGGTTTTTPAKPTFKDVSKTVYATGDINLRSSWSTSSAAVQVEKGTELRLTGTSTEKVNGYVWYRVTYNGKIKYVSKDLITETKPEEEKSKNANLKSLTIEGVDLIPEFNPEVTEYSVKLIDFKDRDLNITAEPEDEKSVVKIVGNTNITDENEITITVTAEDGTSKIYTIKAIKETTKAFGLASLTIKDVELKGFSTEKYEYKVQFETLDKLEIEAIATEEGATIEILGNENLKEGENLITIMVTSVDGTKTATYQIKATKLVVVEQEEVKEINMKAVLISGIIALVVLVIIIILITVYVRRNSLPVVDYEYHDNLDNNNENDTEFADEIAPNTNSEKEVKTSRVDELFTQDIEEDRPRRRGKGKHSK